MAKVKEINPGDVVSISGELLKIEAIRVLYGCMFSGKHWKNRVIHVHAECEKVEK